MQITGAIRPNSSGNKFTREAWCQFISSRPEFHRRPPREVPNPFKPGTTMTTPQHKDAAEVVVGGYSVGSVWWSMSEEPLVNVKVEPSAIPLVLEWATALGGEFRQESW